VTVKFRRATRPLDLARRPSGQAVTLLDLVERKGKGVLA
jgi:hypothetical protein